MATVTVPEPTGVRADHLASDSLYEIIDGQRKEVQVGWYEAFLAFELGRRLGNFAGESQHRGQAFVETLIRLPLARDRNRRPDVAYFSPQRWRDELFQDPSGNALDALPDLVAEVVSPYDLADELLEKIAEYFEAGVTLVWVIYPRRRLVYVYESLTRVRGLTQTDELDGGSVLPGFRLPLAELFR